MAASPAYGEEKGGSSSLGEPEYGHDPASGGIFSSDYKRHDDLKEMLDSNKDSLKLEAMKRIVAMIARGKNASDLFPAVVKNVACKNIEVKKLVYVYLVRYAEEQQDLALLSISTFQRGLKVGWFGDPGRVWGSSESPTAVLQPPSCPHRTPTS
uniref:Clathrin/coatomer adaptor adaptin-like N-terminal domain-containing protein n=1 Tax=Strix occidentalis caurina TaxID=311401 RepID=A0A8D0EKI8_STROC